MPCAVYGPQELTGLLACVSHPAGAAIAAEPPQTQLSPLLACQTPGIDLQPEWVEIAVNETHQHACTKISVHSIKDYVKDNTTSLPEAP